MKNISIKLIKDIGKILIPFVIYYLTYYVAYILLTILVIEIVHLDKYIPEHETTIRAILGGISMLIGALPLISDFKQEIRSKREACRQQEIISERETHRQGKTDRRKEQRVFVPITITLAITSSIVINFLFIRLHILEASATYSHVAEHQYGVNFIIGIILYGLVSPFAEEVVFRGIIYNKIRKGYPTITAVILSAFLFGLYHGNIVQGAYGFLMGILLAYTYERFGSFIHAFLFHSMANITVYIITSNEAVYNVIMTPYICVVLAVIAAVMLWLMGMVKKYCMEVISK